MTPYFSIVIKPPLLTSSLQLMFPISLPISFISLPKNNFIVIIKVKIITLYKAYKCDYSIAIRVCGVAILQEVVTLACI